MLQKAYTGLLRYNLFGRQVSDVAVTLILLDVVVGKRKRIYPLNREILTMSCLRARLILPAKWHHQYMTLQ